MSFIKIIILLLFVNSIMGEDTLVSYVISKKNIIIINYI